MISPTGGAHNEALATIFDVSAFCLQATDFLFRSRLDVISHFVAYRLLSILIFINFSKKIHDDCKRI